MATPLLPAHLLCVVSVCKLPAHGAVITSKGKRGERAEEGRVNDLMEGYQVLMVLIWFMERIFN